MARMECLAARHGSAQPRRPPALRALRRLRGTWHYVLEGKQVRSSFLKKRSKRLLLILVFVPPAKSATAQQKSFGSFFEKEHLHRDARRKPSTGPLSRTAPSTRLTIGETASLSHTVTQRDIDLFAVVTGDVNPAHVDPGLCRDRHVPPHHHPRHVGGGPDLRRARHQAAGSGDDLSRPGSALPPPGEHRRYHDGDGDGAREEARRKAT